MATLGEKLKKARLAKNLTQKELAGDKMTRNMISEIENNSAQPSLSAVCYLARKLDLPIGYLLSEPDNEMMYSHQIGLTHLRSAFFDGRYGDCLEIISRMTQDDSPEVRYIFARSHYDLGLQKYDDGHLAGAYAEFHTVYECSVKQFYEADRLKKDAAVRMALIYSLDKTLCAGQTPDISEIGKIFDEAQDELYIYLRVLNMISQGQVSDATAIVNSYLIKDSYRRAHLTAKLFMQNRQYDVARQALLHINLDAPGLSVLMKYNILSDLETCCVMTSDYQGAYEATQKKNRYNSIIRL